MNDRDNTWILPLRSKGEKVRLICFPYAGGGPCIFQKWSAWLAAHVGLYSVNLPGRGTRLQEAPVSRLQPIVNALLNDLHRLRDMPFVFFGHSMGALLAFETARALRLHGIGGPCLLVASGCRPPRMAEQREKTHHLSDEAFLQKLSELGGTPNEVLQSSELMALLMPALRADFSVIDSYQYEPSFPLDYPITVVSGAQDDLAHGSMMADWRTQTSSVLSLHELQGGHFFIHTAEAELQRIITRDIDRWANPSISMFDGLAWRP